MGTISYTILDPKIPTDFLGLKKGQLATRAGLPKLVRVLWGSRPKGPDTFVSFGHTQHHRDSNLSHLSDVVLPLALRWFNS